MFQSAMGMSMDGTMSDCPFMPGMSMCAMSPLEHVSLMQNFFKNITQQENPILSLLLALTFIATIGVVWFRRLVVPPNLSLLRQLQYFYRQRSYSILRLLQELFSNGILNPKSF
jgi:hypothetical protein